MHTLARRAAALLAAACTLASVSIARADLAPPPGYVEMCSIEKQKQPNEECRSCAAFHGNPDHCVASLGDYGFAKRCQSRGASVWSELWCRPASASAKVVPPGVLAQLGNPNGMRLGDDPPAAPAATIAPVADPASPPAIPAVSEPPAPPPVPPSGGCGSCAVGDQGAGAGLLAGLAVIAAAASLAGRRVTTRERRSPSSRRSCRSRRSPRSPARS